MLSVCHVARACGRARACYVLTGGTAFYPPTQVRLYCPLLHSPFLSTKSETKPTTESVFNGTHTIDMRSNLQQQQQNTQAFLLRMDQLVTAISARTSTLHERMEAWGASLLTSEPFSEDSAAGQLVGILKAIPAGSQGAKGKLGVSLLFCFLFICVKRVVLYSILLSARKETLTPPKYNIPFLHNN